VPAEVDEEPVVVVEPLVVVDPLVVEPLVVVEPESVVVVVDPLVVVEPLVVEPLVVVEVVGAESVALVDEAGVGEVGADGAAVVSGDVPDAVVDPFGCFGTPRSEAAMLALPRLPTPPPWRPPSRPGADALPPPTMLGRADGAGADSTKRQPPTSARVAQRAPAGQWSP
jgi:hypothetical protein